MGKFRKTAFLGIFTFVLIFSMVCIQNLPGNTKTEQIDRDLFKESSDSIENLENTFNFIINRLKEIRNSEDFALSEEISSNSFKLTASDADESVDVDESYQIKNIMNPHQTNQNSTTQTLSPVNRTTLDVIMGFTYQLIYYKWEISWNLEIFGYKIAYAYFGIEIDIGAGIRFPINVSVDYPTELLVDATTSLNITLHTVDLPNYNETYFHFIARIYAGVSAFGYDGEWSMGPNYRVDRSYETPLGTGKSVDLGEIQIPILEILGKLDIPYVSSIAKIISSIVVDVLIKLRFSVGSDLLTIKATLFGNDTHFDDQFGPNTKTLNFTQSPQTENLFIYTKDPGHVRLELNDFQYHLNLLNIDILLGLTWKTIFSSLFDDREWLIYTFVIPLGNLLVFDSSNSLTIQMNATSVPPTESYGAQMVYISPMESIELGKDVAEYYVFIENTGQNIEHDIYDIEVTDIDPSWVIHPPDLTIKQGSIGFFILKIDPPRDSGSSAGMHSFTVTATSSGDPSENDSITENLNILPYYEAKVERISILDTGLLNMTPDVTESLSFNITNTGNIAETFALSMSAQGINSSIFELPANATLAPGEIITISPNVTVPKSPDFPALHYSVELLAQSQTDSTSSAYDTVQMTVLPFRNLSISITEKEIPEKILPGSVLTYDVHVENNGNFNDTIELSVLGIPSDSYVFGIDSEILFPGQVVDTILTITIPQTSMHGETLDLTFVAQFASNETIQIEQSFIIQTGPNYLPLIITLVIVGIVAAFSPYYYKGIKGKLIPYVKHKRDARIVRKYRRREDEILIKIDYCLYCSHKLTEVDLKLLNSDQNTLCENCGSPLTPAHLQIFAPKKRSIDEVVSEKMDKYRTAEEEKKKIKLEAKRIKEEKIKLKREADERIKQYKEKLAKGPLPPLTMEFCPHCFKKIPDIDTRLLKKGQNTWCPHCKKFIEPKHYEK